MPDRVPGWGMPTAHLHPDPPARRRRRRRQQMLAARAPPARSPRSRAARCSAAARRAAQGVTGYEQTQHVGTTGPYPCCSVHPSGYCLVHWHKTQHKHKQTTQHAGGLRTCGDGRRPKRDCTPPGPPIVMPGARGWARPSDGRHPRPPPAPPRPSDTAQQYPVLVHYPNNRKPSGHACRPCRDCALGSG